MMVYPINVYYTFRCYDRHKLCKRRYLVEGEGGEHRRRTRVILFINLMGQSWSKSVTHV